MTTPETEQEPREQVDAAGRAAPRLARRLAVVLALVCVALAVLAVVLGLRLRDIEERDDRRDAALQAARQSALNLTSVDKDDADGDIERVLEGATGVFREDFEEQAERLKGLLEENEVVSQGQVLEAGLVRSDATTATALVVVDSSVRNTAAPDGRVNTYRMKLELERVDGRWLTSQLQFVG